MPTIRIVDPTAWIDWDHFAFPEKYPERPCAQAYQERSRVIFSIDNLGKYFPDFNLKFGDIVLKKGSNSDTLIEKIKKKRQLNPNYYPLTENPVDDLIGALQDTSICCIWTYGASNVHDGKSSRAELVDILTQLYCQINEISVSEPKPFVSYCGFTALIFFLEQYGLARSIHGPLVAHFGFFLSDMRIKQNTRIVSDLTEIFHSNRKTFEYEGILPLNESAKKIKPNQSIKGNVLGGLVQIVSAYFLMAPFFDKYVLECYVKGSLILFIEFYDAGDESTMVESLLSSIKRNPDQIKMLMIGTSKPRKISSNEEERTAYNKKYEAKISDIENQIASACDKVKIPVLSGLSVGHKPPNLPLPFGDTELYFDASKEKISLEHSGKHSTLARHSIWNSYPMSVFSETVLKSNLFKSLIP